MKKTHLINFHHHRVDMIVVTPLKITYFDEMLVHGKKIIFSDKNYYYDKKQNKKRWTKHKDVIYAYYIDNTKGCSLIQTTTKKFEIDKERLKSYSESQFNDFLDNAFNYDKNIKRINEYKKRKIQYQKEQIEEEQIEELKKLKEKEKMKQENLAYNGFLDNMKPMLRQRTINTLDNLIRANQVVSTKKVFVETLIDNGAIPRKENDVVYHKRNGGTTKPKTVYRIEYKDNMFYIVSKTEFNYAIHLRLLTK